MIDQAFLLASQLHGKQHRKASIVPGAPYLSHLMEVAGMVLANGGSTIEGAAALLHDAVEDQGEMTRALICKQCGPEVLALVEECTEEGTGGAIKAPWQERKASYVQHILSATPGALLISVADKLQSAREVKRQLRFYGDETYGSFVKKEYATIPERKAAVIWFHTALVKAFNMRLITLRQEQPENPVFIGVKALLVDFEEVVNFMESH